MRCDSVGVRRTSGREMEILLIHVQQLNGTCG